MTDGSIENVISPNVYVGRSRSDCDKLGSRLMLKGGNRGKRKIDFFAKRQQKSRESDFSVGELDFNEWRFVANSLLRRKDNAVVKIPTEDSKLNREKKLLT